MISCLQSLGSSKYSDILLEYPGYKEYISDGGESENDDTRRLYELKNKENELISEYYNNTFGTYIITDELGKKYEYSQVKAALWEALDQYQNGIIGYDEYKKYDGLLEKYYEESAAVLGSILIELVNTRNQIAALSGYSSYEEYAASEIYKRDYPVEYSRNLCEYVKQYIEPLYRKTAEKLSEMPEVSALNMTEEELLSLHGECVNDISDEMYAVWQKMINNNALIILDKDNTFYSAGSGSTYSFVFSGNIQECVMIGSDPDKPVYTLRALQHEFGHYNNNAYVTNSRFFPYDISEINSSGLENLFTYYYDRIYGDEADAAELMELEEYLNIIIFNACLYEFLHIIYSEPDLSIEKLNDIYVRVSNEYGNALSSDDIYDKTTWMFQKHLYTKPFYAISYVTSYTTTLELWGEKEKDFYAAADKYLRFAALEENEGVIKMLEKGGYGNVFEEDTVRKTAESIDRLMGYGIWPDRGTGTDDGDSGGSDDDSGSGFSGGGSSSGGSYENKTDNKPETISTPAGETGNTPAVSATVTDNKATVSEIKAADVAEVKAGENVTIDLSSAKNEVSSISLTKSTLENIASSEASGAEIKLSEETAIKLDQAALEAIVQQAQTADISLELKTGEKAQEYMNKSQKEAVAAMNNPFVVDISITAGTERISDLLGGRIDVTVPFITDKNALACFIDDFGNMQAVACEKIGNAVTMHLRHNSYYVIEEADGFVDVADDAYYRDAVNWAFSNTITSGTDETHFSPSDITTRAQMVTFLWRAAGSPEPELRSLPFSDVREDSYYYKAVLWAAGKGIVNGISENEFAPDTVVSRAQTVTFLYRYEGVDTMEIKDNPFSDVADGQYYTDAVLWANARNITNGTGESEFSPDVECQRAQIVSFLYRYLGQN